MQPKTRKLMARCILSVFTLLIFFFNVSANVTAFEKNIIIKNSTSLYKVGTPDKYSTKAAVSAKDKTSMMSFKSSELTWININNKPVLKNPAWTFDDNNYNWKPSDKSQFIKIPLRQKITANKTSLELVNEIEIEYQDLFPDNPVLPLLKIITLDKKNLIKKILHFQEHPFSEELLDLSSTSWVKKNNLYLVRRALGIKFKPVWHYSQHNQQTVLQRQLKKNLHDN